MLEAVTKEVALGVLSDAWAAWVPQMALFYVVSQALLAKLFPRSLYERHKPAWKMLMAAYNFALSAYSLATFVFAFNAVAEQGLFTGDCQNLFRNRTFERAAYYFYLSKYVEFADTYFLVVAGREVSWLQYFHHLGAPVDMWVLYAYGNEGIWLFVVFNSFIHTLMYLYYAMTALGKSLNSLKIVMTSLQIVQLVAGNSISTAYVWHDCYRNDGRLILGWSVNMAYICVLIVLFGEFFISSYCHGGHKGGHKSGRAKETSKEA
jgi:hypothetical protein